MNLANLTRYSMYAKGVSEYNSELKPNPQLGEWVKFEDVRELLKQADNKQSTPLFDNVGCIICGSKKVSLNSDRMCRKCAK